MQVISEQVANGQTYRNRTASTRGRQAIAKLTSETSAIVKEYTLLLDTPFTAYCENQRSKYTIIAVSDAQLHSVSLTSHDLSCLQHQGGQRPTLYETGSMRAIFQ